MFKWLRSPILWGVVLVLGGALLLLQNFGYLPVLGSLFWASVAGLGSLALLGVFIQDRQHWWALIPAITLAGVAALVLLAVIAPPLANQWGGVIFLGAIGLSFLAVYLADRSNWWAIIPGGVMATLAAEAGFGTHLPAVGAGGLFFFGLGFTFALVALLPTPQGNMTWAWIPAGILLLIGALVIGSLGNLLNVIWPTLLILGGLLLLVRAFRR